MTDPTPAPSTPAMPVRDATVPLVPPPAATVPPTPFCTALPHLCPCIPKGI